MFKPTVKLFTLFGITVGMNYSFPLVVALFGFLYGPIIIPIYLLMGLCIVAHEFGHALTGRRFFDGDCDYISLHALGGVAMVTQPRTPKGEFWVALAGPLTSLAISILLMPFVYFFPTNYILYAVMILNLCVAVFNLVPALPMDGGRILRAALAHYKGYRRATILALKVSRVAVGVAVLAGLYYGSVFLIIVAAFVFFLGQQEERNL